MTIPLVQTGPGGTYTTRYLPQGSRLLAVTGGGAGPVAVAGPAAGNAGGRSGGGVLFRRRRRGLEATRSRSLIDRLLGIDRVELSRQALERTEDRLPDGVAWTGPVPHPLSAAASSWLQGQRLLLDQIARKLRSLAAAAPPVAACPAIGSVTVRR